MAPIVLGLPWLCMHNPVIDWKELCLMFQDRNVRISAALASEIVQPGAEGVTEGLGRGVNGEEIHEGTLQSPPEAPQQPPKALQQPPEAPLKAPRTRVKLEEVKDGEYEVRQPGPHELFPSDKNLGPDGPILMGINEWLAFASKSTEQEVEEILEAGRSAMEKVTPQPAKDSEEAYQKWKRAAGMDRLLREGTPAYFLHILPTKEDSPTKEMLQVSDSNDPERVQQPKDPESGNPSPEQGGVKELNEEASKRQETEELKKSIPV
ncbi:hypothetical protein GG344DRAFT_83489 [Lentinula edodes]|nr:hypothetical protein GG344DRAFT_83489 [Lentinula edodes]